MRPSLTAEMNEVIGALSAVLLLGFTATMLKTVTLTKSQRYLPSTFSSPWAGDAWRRVIEYDRYMTSKPPVSEWFPRYDEKGRVYYEEHYLDDAMRKSIEWKHITVEDARELKLILGGYYLMATERADEAIVNDVYHSLIRGIKQSLEKHRREPPHKSAEEKGLEKELGTGLEAKTQTERTLWIDRVVATIMHAGGLDVYGLKGSYIGHMFAKVLAELALEDEHQPEHYP